MSGILAIFDTSGAPVSRERLAAMAQAMDYRGPDGIDFSLHGNVGLGHLAQHTRKAQDETVQPLASDDGRHVVVFDGYLLNGADLRRDLRASGITLRSEADAETVLQAYRRWGGGCTARLEGEFAFAIWDEVERRLVCARDHCSLRPLAWHWDGSTLLVASDVSAIIAGLAERPPPNFGYLAEQIANEWHTHDETPWQGIHKLPPAAMLVLSQARAAPHVETYWQVPLDITIRYSRDEEYFEHYRSLLDEVVCGAATSDRPIGFDVSGGLDSSAVFCLADRALRDGRLDAPGLHGVALLGNAGDRSDERKYFRAVGQHTGRHIAEVGLFEPELDWFHQQGRDDALPPFAPNASMMIAVHEEMARAGCRVALTGHGGDKWLNGTMLGYRQAIRAGDWSAVAAQFRADQAAMGMGKALFAQLRHGIAPLAPEGIRRAWQHYRPVEDQPYASNFWLAADLRQELRDRRARRRAALMEIPSDRRFKVSKWGDPFDLFVNEIVNLLGARRQVDYRSPMLSRRFIEFSARTPEHIRLRAGVRKFVHRQAMRGIIPDLVRKRTDKAFFDSSFRRLHPAIHLYLRQEMERSASPCIDREGVERLFVGELGTATDKSPIWEVWGVFAHFSFLANEGPTVGKPQRSGPCQ